MKKYFLIFALLVNFFNGCSKNTGQGKEKADGKFFRKIVINAINGNITANDSLNKLIDFRLPLNFDYNDLKIDSLKNVSGKTLYTVLLQYPNPVYNRFAVYDSAFNNYLIDKSLNGKISEENFSANGLKFLKVNEQFISKEIFNLNRLSLYSVGDTSVNLVFRTLAGMKNRNLEYTQQVDEITADRIKTTSNSNKYSPVRNKSDIFTFNSKSDKYESSNNIFDKYITSQIENSKNSLEKPEITDEKSAWESVGKNPAADTINYAGNSKSTVGFSLTLSEDWKEFKNFALTEYVNKKFKGTRYFNSIIGTTISIVQIPAEKVAEDFINYKLEKVSEGKIRLRYTDEIITGRDFVQFFEYYCGGKKFLLILQGSKYTYNDYKDLYSKIINSFSMGC